MVGRVYTLKTHNPRETIHKWEESPKEWGIWVPHQAPPPRGPALKRWAPRMAGCEDQHSFHTGKLEGCRTQKCCPKGHTENLTGATKSQSKGSNREGAWVRPTFWSWRASQKGRRRLGLTLETQVPTAVTMRTLVVASTILESSLYSFSMMGLPTHQQASTSLSSSRSPKHTALGPSPASHSWPQPQEHPTPCSQLSWHPASLISGLQPLREAGLAVT